MTRSEIDRMAREAGIYRQQGSATSASHLFFNYVAHEKRFEHFANSIAATERELCAKQLDALGCDHCATAIRAKAESA